MILNNSPFKKNSNMILFIISTSLFMWSLSAGMVNIALPTMSQFLDVSVSTISWVVLAHLLFLLSFLLIFGKIGDHLGYKNIFVVGLIIFSFSSYYSGLSLNIVSLIGYRIIQGIGSAMILSVAPAIISTVFKAGKRGKAFGYISLATAGGLAFGNWFGGFLTEYFSWHYIFFIVFFMGLILLFLSIVYLPEEEVKKSKFDFDYVGAVLIISSIMLFLLTINFSNTVGWCSLAIFLLFLIAIVCSILFCLWELRTTNPLVDISILKNYYLTLSLTGAFLINLVLSGTIFIIPFFLQLVKGYSSGFAGFIIFAPTALVVVASPLAGHLSDLFGSNMVKISSTILLIASSILLMLLNPTIGILVIVTALALRALSQGIFTPVNTKTIMNQSIDESMGIVSSLMNLFRYLGLVMGVVIFQAIFQGTIAANGISNMGAFQVSAPQNVLLSGFYSSFFLATILSILIFVLAVIEIRFDPDKF